ncbi:4871_t:CDS:2, partial [Gigaspora rosea]
IGNNQRSNIDKKSTKGCRSDWKKERSQETEWGKKKGITKDNKRKPKEAEEKAKMDLVIKRRKCKEKQTPHSEA